jgi:hypothetical protein
MADAVPREIRKAAHDATDLPLGQFFRTSPNELIDLALDAAYPLIMAAYRDRILNLLTAWTCPCGEKDCAGYDTRDRLAELIEEDSR